MFKATLTDVDLLKNSIPIISEIIDEGLFKVDKSGISLLSPDRTMVSVIDFRLHAAAFESYEVEGEQEMGLNMANFVSVLRRVKSTDKVTLELSGKTNKLKITVEGDSRRVFEIPLLDIKAEKPPIEQLAFPGRVEVESRLIEEGIADADVVGDSVVFELKPEVFSMRARGDVSSAELAIAKGDSGMLKIQAKESLAARYPLEYLKKMIKANKLSNQMSIELGNDYPMRLDFRSIDKLSLSFILAPRVEE
ncbi:MAG: proliferating cell nuclear antigen (pcna) [Candidatus Aenigmarchaeota archaeon]|nr:proliferating cell nuclear antigen (pcna) [Candidatus Aenigmarchaeota archaeon]